MPDTTMPLVVGRASLAVNPRGGVIIVGHLGKGGLASGDDEEAINTLPRKVSSTHRQLQKGVKTVLPFSF
jgi:hypothetical protein